MTELKEKLGEELYDQVSDKLGDALGKLILNDEGKWFPKERYDKINAQKDELEKQVSDVTAKIKEFEPLAASNESLKEQIEKLKTDIETSKTEYENRIKQQDFDFKLNTAISEAGAKNTKAVKALLKKDAISVDGDNLIGFDDQIKALQESDAYLFGEIKVKGKEPGFSEKTTDTAKYGGYQTKEEFARADPKGYANKFPDGY